jgi:hypothetical protein
MLSGTQRVSAEGPTYIGVRGRTVTEERPCKGVTTIMHRQRGTKTTGGTDDGKSA